MLQAEEVRVIGCTLKLVSQGRVRSLTLKVFAFQVVHSARKKSVFCGNGLKGIVEDYFSD